MAIEGNRRYLPHTSGIGCSMSSFSRAEPCRILISTSFLHSKKRHWRAEIKTLILYPRLALFVLVGLLVSAPSGFGAEPLAGRWEGSIQIPGNELALVVDLAADKAGAWNGSVILPGLSIKGLPLQDVSVRGTETSFAIKGGSGLPIEATCKGKLDGDALTGDFTQGGRTASFRLKQTGPAQVEVAPRSTTITKDLEGEWYGEYELFGYMRKVTLKLTNNAEKGASAEFVVVGKKVNNLPVDLITQENNSISVYSHDSGISIEGQFLKQTNEIRGSWIQGPIEVPLSLKRK